MFVIFSWFKPPVQTADVPSAAAQRSMDAIKKQQTEQKSEQQAPKQ